MTSWSCQIISFSFLHANQYCIMQFIFSHVPYSLLCLYYTGFFKKSLSDYCVKTRRISEIFRNFFVFISDSCYFILAVHPAFQFFVQVSSAISRYFQKNHAKNSLFDNFITKQHAVYLISAFRFWFYHKNPLFFFFGSDCSVSVCCVLLNFSLILRKTGE